MKNRIERIVNYTMRERERKKEREREGKRERDIGRELGVKLYDQSPNLLNAMKS